MPVAVTAVDQVALSVLVEIVNAPVFQPVFSPPRPACLTTNDETVCAEPRSTVSVRGVAPVHHLLLSLILPSTAMAADSPPAQAAAPLVIVLPRARSGPRGGSAAGWVAPSPKLGGTSPPPVPQDEGEDPIVYAMVPPPAMSEYLR
jgi:hypothetical protein